jgi:hypothetical protein
MEAAMNQPSQRHHRYTFADYLAYEDGSNVKHEFFNGEIYAMAGGTPEHAALAAAMTTLIGAQLGEAPCRAFSSDLKIRVLATGLVSYPDLTVICGSVEYDPQSRMVAVNPTSIVEVLSDSTEDWDRGEKLENFKQIPSLVNACWSRIGRRSSTCGAAAPTVRGAIEEPPLATLSSSTRLEARCASMRSTDAAWVRMARGAARSELAPTSPPL